MKYDYRCPKCGVITLDHEMGGKVEKCPTCGEPIRKIISNAHHIWNCPGSYSGTKIK